MRIITFIVLLAASDATALAENLVANGSFENGIIDPFPPNTNFPYFETLGVGATNIANWSVVSGTIDYKTSLQWQASDGDRSLDMDGLTFPGSVIQSIPTVPGQLYELTFDMAGNPGGPPTIKELQVCAGTTCQLFTFALPFGDAFFGANFLVGMELGWVKKSILFVAVDSTTALSFTSMTSGQNCEPYFDACNSFGPALDNVVVTRRGDVTRQGSIVAWGFNGSGQVNPPFPNAGFVAVAAGAEHSLGLRLEGSVAAWGSNTLGQSDVPLPNTSFVAVAAGYAHSLGLKRDGSIVGWGRCWDGQCDVPTANTGFVSVAGGFWNSVGLKSDGAVVVWGSCVTGQCDVPHPNADFVAVASNAYHTLGLKADGSIVAWGCWVADYGQCNVPSPNTNFVAIAAGLYHSLGLKADGSIVAWGLNNYGQTNVPAPNSGFIAITAGGFHSLGLNAHGSIVGWGNDSNGETNVPAPNTGLIALAAGINHSLGIRTSAPPTQSVVLDFEHDAPFRVVVPIVNLPFPSWVPFVGTTPVVDKADTRLVPLLHEPDPDKDFNDFTRDILRKVRDEYAGFRVEFVLNDSDASLPPSQQSTVYFSGQGPEGFGGGGMAVWWNLNPIDICNLNRTDIAIVFLPLDIGYDYQTFVRVTGNAVVHEVGHLLGLWHTYPIQTETQHMWFQSTSDERSFVGRSLCVLPPPLCSPAVTQNDKAALALSVGAYPSMESQLVSHGSLDGVCFLAKIVVDVHSTSSLYGLKALACSPPDACRLIDIGDMSEGESKTVDVGIGPGEFLTITGSSLPFVTAASGQEVPTQDVFAYFGPPKGDRLSDLDPSLFALAPDASQLSIETHSAVLLQTDGTLVSPVGDATGTASQTGDLNVDGSVGPDDYRVLSNCLMGPDAKVAETCWRADLDGDRDVDMRDLSYFLDIIGFFNSD